MDDEERSLVLPGMLSPTGKEIFGRAIWVCQETEQPLDRFEMALMRYQDANPSLRVVRRDGKAVTEWALALDSLPLGYLRVSRKRLEIDASVQGHEAWQRHPASAEGRKLWQIFLLQLYEEMRVGAVLVERPARKGEPKGRASKQRKPLQAPKGTARARWVATWRYIRPHVERGLTNPRELLGLLARERATEHLANLSEDTMRKIVAAGLAGRLNAP